MMRRAAAENETAMMRPVLELRLDAGGKEVADEGASSVPLTSMM
jgi:hypothetical protein